MRLVLTEFVSLDGVCQGPGSETEDTTDGFTRGGWFVPYMDEAFIDIATDWIADADAFLFGRRTYQAFAEAWPQVTDPNDLFAPRLNGLPKFVASRAGTDTPWGPATVLSGDVPARVAELKRGDGRTLQIHGSARLAQGMLAAGLIDEVRLAIAPVVVGAGRRLFPEGSAPTGLRVRQSWTTPAGMLCVALETRGAAIYANYTHGR